MSHSPEATPPQQIPPGWYPNAQGTAQWWDGQKWLEGTPTPDAPAYQQPSTTSRRIDKVHRVVFLIGAWAFVVGFGGVAILFMGFVFFRSGEVAGFGLIMMVLGFPVAVVATVVHLLINAVRMAHDS